MVLYLLPQNNLSTFHILLLPYSFQSLTMMTMTMTPVFIIQVQDSLQMEMSVASRMMMNVASRIFLPRGLIFRRTSYLVLRLHKVYY